MLSWLLGASRLRRAFAPLRSTSSALLPPCSPLAPRTGPAPPACEGSAVRMPRQVATTVILCWVPRPSSRHTRLHMRGLGACTIAACSRERHRRVQRPRCCAHASNVVNGQLPGTCRWRHGRLTPELNRCCDAASTEHKRQAAQGEGRKPPLLSHLCSDLPPCKV